MDTKLIADYLFCRSYGMRASHALHTARRDKFEACAWWFNRQRSELTARVRINMRGLDRIEQIAEHHGVTVREYLEALMHYAISTHERPGSWEAQGFDFANYRGDGYADKWF
jgi:hypothetical protein